MRKAQEIEFARIVAKPRSGVDVAEPKITVRLCIGKRDVVHNCMEANKLRSKSCHGREIKSI